MPDEAYGLTPELLSKMTVEKWFDGGGIREVMRDSTYEPHSKIGGLQNTALTWILNPTTLRRVYDNEFRRGDGEDAITVAEILNAVRESVWSELDTRPAGDSKEAYVSSLRRNLQRAHLNPNRAVGVRRQWDGGGVDAGGQSGEAAVEGDQ